MSSSDRPHVSSTGLRLGGKIRVNTVFGNVGSCSANVTVAPSDDNPVVDDGQFFDATEVN